MTETFLKFKRKLQTVRVVKALLAGLAGGGLAGGVVFTFIKLALLPLDLWVSMPIGAGVFLAVAAAFFFLLRTTDKRLAQTLDKNFALKEKVQTAVAYQGEEGTLLELQRQDAEQTLANIPTKRFKIKRLWIYLVALCVGLSSVAVGFLVKDRRNPVVPPTPFAISEMQIAGIEELIGYVDNSKMQTDYKQSISASLSNLLADLKAATIEPEMQTALTVAMANIQNTTYASSSLAEILNALWATEDAYARGLATMLNTSAWKEPNWGDYAEKLSAYKADFRYETAEGETTPPEEDLYKELKWNLENGGLKINMALTQSQIAEEDILYQAVSRFANANEGTLATEHIFGILTIAKDANVTTYAQTLDEVDNTLDTLSQDTYDVIAQLKINSNVGEYVMTKLATLFPVPLPKFERPDLSASGNQQGGAEEKPNDKGPSDGGIGEGATFGSKDLVLDPLTGQYVEYGTLLNKYYAVMSEKLDNGTYTDEQKEIIKNYFSLLYSGIEKEE